MRPLTLLTTAAFAATLLSTTSVSAGSENITDSARAHVAVVFYNESYARPLELLAQNIVAGAEAAGAEARLFSVNGDWPYSESSGGAFTTDIDQERDLLGWADAIVSWVLSLSPS